MSEEKHIPPWLNPSHLSYNEDEDCYTLKCNEDKDGIERSSFSKALGSLQHSKEFRRLKDTKQVYSCPDHNVRDRLTHSLEVSNVCKQLVKFFFEESVNLGLIDKDKQYYDILDLTLELCEFSCLAHDIGHPPFAHTAEKYLDNYLPKRYFDSNVQNLRILGKLTPEGKGQDSYPIACIDASLKKKHFGYISTFKYRAREEHFLELLSAELGTFIVHPQPEPKDKKIFNKRNEYLCKPDNEKRMIFFSTKIKDLEKDLPSSVKAKAKFKSIEYIRHPVAYFMEASDDISYISSDIEDALNLGILDTEYLKKHLEKLVHQWKDVLLNEIKGIEKIEDIKGKGNEHKLNYFESLIHPINILNEKNENKIKIENIEDIEDICKIDIIENFQLYFDKKIENNEFSKIKTLILRILIAKTKISFKKFLSNTKERLKSDNFEKIDKTNSFIEYLPQWFYIASIEELQYKEDEPANFLYFNIGNDFNKTILKFKKDIFSNHLFKVNHVKLNNFISEQSLIKYIESILPKTSEEAHLNAGKMGSPLYSSKIYALKSEETYINGDAFEMMLDVFIDYLISLSDAEMMNRASDLGKVTKIVSESDFYQQEMQINKRVL